MNKDTLIIIIIVISASQSPADDTRTLLNKVIHKLLQEIVFIPAFSDCMDRLCELWSELERTLEILDFNGLLELE